MIIHNVKVTEATGEIAFRVQEEQTGGRVIGSLKEKLKIPDPLHFILLDKTEYFTLDSQNGDLYTTEKKLDRESVCPFDSIDECVITIDVFVSSEDHSEITKVKVFVEDINDNAPYFTEDTITLSIPEDAAVGSMFPIDHLARDADAENNRGLTYQLHCPDHVFTLDHRADVISLTVSKPLNRESQSEYKIILIASDRGSPSLSGSAALIVQIIDVNDNCPVFLTNNISVSLPKNSSVNTTVAQLVAFDEDIGENGVIQYVYSSRVPEASKKLFNLDSSSGIIILSALISDERTQLHVLPVLAVGPGCVPDVAVVKVTFQELTKQQPRMEFRFIGTQDTMGVSLKEDVSPNTVIAILEIKDPDHSILRPPYINGISPFLLKPSESSPDTYLLLTSKQLDFESEQKYTLHIIGNSTFDKSKFHEEILSITIEDVNDNAPQFPQGLLEVFIDENNNAGEPLLKVSASDADGGSNGDISYSLGHGAPDMFSIDSSSGILTTTASFDRENEMAYSFPVIAMDHGSPSLNNSCIIKINILDKNDNAPRFSTTEFTFFIPENLPRYGEVGIINVTDVDFGLNGEFTLLVLNVTKLFSVGPDRILRSKDYFDYELERMYEVWVEAKDKGNPPLVSRAKIHVFILDVNDNAPLILSPESNFSYVLVSPDITKGSSITKVHAVDYDTGMNGIITYSEFGEVDPNANLFKIDTITGNITLKETTNIQHCGLYQMLVKASDQGYPEALSAIVRVNILLNHSISNRSYVESLIMDKTITTKSNQVIMLSPCPQYKAMALLSWSLTAPVTLAILSISALCCMTGTFLFLCRRKRHLKKKKRPDVQIPLKHKVDYCMKDWNEM
ncbi:protocadherin-20-like [Spea bombifrons]|uniref:protocadherin-20-like n=1 Tax=Spea bombifrons TaxID=233779 RepID=UPI00234B99DA|nr:protocadherin-20-like [Spea bombifrons]